MQASTVYFQSTDKRGGLWRIAYMVNLHATIDQFSINHHAYADDTQLLACAQLKDAEIWNVALPTFTNGTGNEDYS